MSNKLVSTPLHKFYIWKSRGIYHIWSLHVEVTVNNFEIFLKLETVSPPCAERDAQKTGSQKNMAMENSDSISSQKRSWEESESCPTIETVPKASSNGEDEISTSKKLCVSPESGAGDGPIQSSSKPSLPGLKLPYSPQVKWHNWVTARKLWLSYQCYI